MPTLLTIKSKDNAKEIKGYALPKNIRDFELPITLLLSNDYTPTLYTDRTLTKKVTDSYKSLNIVDRDIKEGLLFNEDGYILKWNPNPKLSLVAPKMLEKSVKDTTIKKPETSTIDEKARTTQIAWTVGGWALIYYIYKKYWDKSNAWKGGIIIASAYNAYNTYKIFSQPAVVTQNKK